jgi:hypothetical protein
MPKTRNFFILMTILLLGLVFVLVAEYFYDVSSDNLEACTEEARLCPDGSVVGRTGPNCEFAPCPTPIPEPEPLPAVASFTDCVEAGNSVLESYPRQCRHNGELFVEELTVSISNFPIRYGEDVSRMEEFRSDCEQRMGVFNECGSACPPDAEECDDVCSMICEGPASEFMPPVPLESTFCTPASRSVDACIEIYQPVCGQVQVECITTPCNPVPETFPNSCFACQNERVISYTEGECVLNEN